MKPLLHPASQQLLDAVVRNLPQSFLLTGEEGVGLATIASWIAGKNIASIVTPKDAKGNLDLYGTISVEAVRQLYDQTKTKQTKARVIIIDNAETMSRSAQAAFLKLLEEPTPYTHFILTSHHPMLLLPTIRSRVQQLSIQPLTQSQSMNYIRSLKITDATKQTQLLFLASGLPAELHRLATNPDYFAHQAVIIGDARAFLQETTYKRLLVIQNYRSNRNEALQLIDSMLRILQHTINKSPKEQLIGKLQQLLEARERIAANQSIHLQLAALVL